MRELKKEHFKEFHNKELLYNSNSIKSIIESTIGLYNYLAIYYNCFVIGPPDEFYKRFTEKDREGLIKIAENLDIKYKQDYENFTNMFNKCYKHGIIEVVKKLFNPYTIVNNDVKDYEEMQFLNNYDEDSRSFIAKIYTETYNKNVGLVKSSIGNYFSKININLEKEEIDNIKQEMFNTDILNHLSGVMMIMKKYFEEFLKDSHISFDKYAIQMAEKDTNELMTYSKKINKFKEDHITPYMTHDQLSKILTGYITEYFSEKENTHLYDKYPTIISWVGYRNDFNPEKFKKVIIDRYKVLGMSHFDIEKRYLISLLPKNADYSKKKKEIISVVNATEKAIKKETKTVKEEEKKVDDRYKNYGMKEEELIEGIEELEI